MLLELSLTRLRYDNTVPDVLFHLILFLLLLLFLLFLLIILQGKVDTFITVCCFFRILNICTVTVTFA